MHVQAARRYIMEVQASTERIPQIRRILAAHLRHWRLDPHIGPVCRAVGELIANVVRHVPGDKTCVVELRWTGRHLIASVADGDRRMPRLTSSCPARGGLAAVAVLSDSWGTCPTAGGKVIWFSRRVKRAERVRLTAPAPLRPAPNALEGPAVPVPVAPDAGRDAIRHGGSAEEPPRRLDTAIG
ncbi:ATP-binding protein [Streptomyces sp. NPDC020141]|uniref:ATP-binding protein n=1 Tax=Streptomyces sp. NPDC020141 TaxID=3365065 RepID=UPI0037B1164B